MAPNLVAHEESSDDDIQDIPNTMTIKQNDSAQNNLPPLHFTTPRKRLHSGEPTAAVEPPRKRARVFQGDSNDDEHENELFVPHLEKINRVMGDAAGPSTAHPQPQATQPEGNEDDGDGNDDDEDHKSEDHGIENNGEGQDEADATIPANHTPAVVNVGGFEVPNEPGRHVELSVEGEETIDVWVGKTPTLAEVKRAYELRMKSQPMPARLVVSGSERTLVNGQSRDEAQALEEATNFDEEEEALDEEEPDGNGEFPEEGEIADEDVVPGEDDNHRSMADQGLERGPQGGEDYKRQGYPSTQDQQEREDSPDTQDQAIEELEQHLALAVEQESELPAPTAPTTPKQQKPTPRPRGRPRKSTQAVKSSYNTGVYVSPNNTRSNPERSSRSPSAAPQQSTRRPKTRKYEGRKGRDGLFRRRNDGLSTATAYDDGGAYDGTISIKGGSLAEVIPIIGSDEWTGAGSMWDAQFLERPHEELQGYNMDFGEELGNELLELSATCQEGNLQELFSLIEYDPFDEGEKEEEGDPRDVDEARRIDGIMTSIDDNISSMKDNMQHRERSSSEHDRLIKDFAVDLRYNVIPLAVLAVELLYLSGSTTLGGSGSGGWPSETRHTADTLAAMSRVLAWASDMEKAVAVANGAAHGDDLVEDMVDDRPAIEAKGSGRALGLRLVRFRDVVEDAMAELERRRERWEARVRERRTIEAAREKEKWRMRMFYASARRFIRSGETDETW